jgi:hypothetical protein
MKSQHIACWAPATGHGTINELHFALSGHSTPGQRGGGRGIARHRPGPGPCAAHRAAPAGGCSAASPPEGVSKTAPQPPQAALGWCLDPAKIGPKHGPQAPDHCAAMWSHPPAVTCPMPSRQPRGPRSPPERIANLTTAAASSIHFKNPLTDLAPSRCRAARCATFCVILD